MPSTRHISKTGTRRTLPVLLLLLTFAVVLALSLPITRAFAANTGGTLLGILVTNSDKGQGTSGTGTTKLSILVTNSATYTITLDNCGGTTPTETVTVPHNKVPQSVTPPDRTGYTFQGYYDDPVNGTQYYNNKGEGVHIWGKNSDGTLYAHWALQIKCTFPSDALIQVDAAGKITGQELSFSSSTVEDVTVTAVTSVQDASAASLFAGDVIPDDLRIVLAPAKAPGEEVEVPLTSTETPIPGGGWTIAAGSTAEPTTLAVAFSLFLPSGAQLNYFPDGNVSIASLTYVVKAANAS